MGAKLAVSKGKTKPVSVYEVFDGDPPELAAKKLAGKTDFEAAVLTYHQKHYDEALDQFNAYLTDFPGDPVAVNFQTRCLKRGGSTHATV